MARYFWPRRIEFEARRRDLAAAFHDAPFASSSLNFVRYGADTRVDAGEQPDCLMFKYTALRSADCGRSGQGLLRVSGAGARAVCEAFR